MTRSPKIGAILLSLAVCVSDDVAHAVGCGCDKFSPGPAEALRAGGALRPTVASRGAEIVLLSDLLVPGEEYVVDFIPLSRGALPGSGDYLPSVPGEPTPRSCLPLGTDDPTPLANPIAIEARDIADYQPLFSLDGTGPHLDAVQASDFPVHPQLRVTVPCALPKLGGTRIDVFDVAGNPVMSVAEDEFTAIGDPLVLPLDGMLDTSYVTGVDTTSHLYIALDLSKALDAVTLSGYAKTLALDINPSDVAAFDVHGMYLDTLREVLTLNAADPTNQQLFDFAIIDNTGRGSDEVAYFRHSFKDWAAQHVPPFGPDFPNKFAPDPVDPYWHLPDVALHPFGSTHTAFDHLVIAVTAHWRRTLVDGTVVTHDLWPGSQLRLPLHIDGSPGNDVPAIIVDTAPAPASPGGDAQWHRRPLPGHPRYRHRHRHHRRRKH